MQTAEALTRSLTADIVAGRLKPGDRLPAVRGLALRLACAPGTVARSYAALRAAHLVEGTPRSSLRVTVDGRIRAVSRQQPALRLAGSDDPALDLLLVACAGQVEVVPGERGSVHGIEQLTRGTADAATLHLFHPDHGTHNADFVRGILGDNSLTMVHLWRREQVLVLPPGNPLGIGGVAELAGRRLAWRDPGSGSRLLLERLLASAGVVAEPTRGVRADSHRGVAIAVVTGAADAGLAVRAAAEAVGADWLPVTVEPFELAIRTQALDRARPLLTALTEPAFRAQVDALGGYDLSNSGDQRAVP